ncbi:protoheme IX farnesyltransferase [Sporothrix schenckii 1099-18]|uniref:Protoheme IX farnesyltransferase, mitochondrial n=2 Tax=Sporothrix schenckii TaxID=29908 RepID=U7Q010_SPOS1|nr:protoheme IX farnesyltransferase [Sporothrix schenckii 1099-18]ERT00497.1 protoheme IX farnesyltransferase [Sporothrix schenckii ATCC 58251]KJR85005.1 protoheme IX farnesyltransferase [Sporothrix schenckii 1099-18]
MPPPGQVLPLLRKGGCAVASTLTLRTAASTGTCRRVWPARTQTQTTHVPQLLLQPLHCHHGFSTSRRAPSASATAGGRGRGDGSASSNSDNATPFEDEHLKKSYFLSNTLMDRVAGLSPGSSLSNSPDPHNPHANAEALPHRRRQAARRQAKLAAAAAASSTSSSTVPSSAVSPEETSASHFAPSSSSDLPENASAILSDMAARQPTTSIRRLASSLLSLAKPRLTVLVVLTAMAPYALYPVPSFLSNGLLETTPSLSPLTLLFLTTGTALCSASANALNMLYEPDTDARMSRTRNRPLVRMLVSRRAALLFAVGCGVAGVAALQWGVNPTVAFLGVANIALYAGVYTPMKRLSVLNTWVGALVGGIPPLMGWAAAAGESAATSSARELLFAPDGSSAGGWLLAALLFAWQFPHFMALSWAVRHEYQRAGLRMLAWVNPARNGRVALRYAAAFLPICVGLCLANVTSWSFAVTSLPVNVWLVREAYQFWRFEGHQGSARRLFWASVWHLPALMVLALLQKKGMWTRVYQSVFGQPVLDDDDELDDDDDDDYLWEDEGKTGSVPAVVPVAASPTSK